MPAEEAIQDNNFVLLYSTLGYDSRGTKRALVRSINAINPDQLAEESSIWRLLDESDSEVASGNLRWLGVTYGIQLWEARFSHVRSPGYYRLTIELVDEQARSVETLTSLEFEVTERLYTKRLLYGLAIANGQERKSGQDWGGGLFDCNNTMGEAYAHGIFLSGLVDTYLRRWADLSTDELELLIDNIFVTVDYLISLHDEATGEIKYQHSSRPCQDCGVGIHNTVEGVYGLVKFMTAFKSVDPGRADEAYQRIQTSIDYLERNNVWSGQMAINNTGWLGLRPLVYFHLFKYSDDVSFETATFDSLREFLHNFDLRLADRITFKGIPYFEGFFRIATEFGSHPDSNEWRSWAVHFDQQFYQHVLSANGFEVVPQGNGASQWDDMETQPLGHHPDFRWYANTHFLASAQDAVYLALLSRDRSLERISAGCLSWILGLNPGVPFDMVVEPSVDKPLLAAAFVANLHTQHASAWTWWAWGPLAPPALTIMNGFRILDGEWSYTDSWESAETFIKHDGAFLSAMTLYEDYLSSLGLRYRRGGRRLIPEAAEDHNIKKAEP